jgi:hypothetical protein
MRVICRLPLIVPAVLGLAACETSPPPATTQIVVQQPAGTIAPAADATTPADVGTRSSAAAELGSDDLAARALALQRDRWQSVDLATWAICRRSAGCDGLGSWPVAAAEQRLGLARGPLGLIARLAKISSIARLAP